MCPVTCDHALSIEVLSLSLLFSRRRSGVRHAIIPWWRAPKNVCVGGYMSFLLFWKKIEPATADRRFIGLNRLQAWENNQHFPTFYFQGDVAKCFLWLQLRRPASLWTGLWSSAIFFSKQRACSQASGLPASSSISSGERSQPRENTRASESGQAFLPPFLALASFRVPLAHDFSRYSDDMCPPTEDLVCRIQYQL